MNWVVDVPVSNHDGDTVTRTMAYEVLPETASIEEYEDPACDQIVSGPSLVVRGHATVEADSGWLIASGPVIVRAQSLDPGQIWVDALFEEMTVSAEVETYAASKNRTACENSTFDLAFSQRSLPTAPWSLGPRGGISMTVCNGALMLYTWSPE